MLALISSKTEKAYHEREEIATAIALARESERRHRVCLSIWTIGRAIRSLSLWSSIDPNRCLPAICQKACDHFKSRGLTRSQLKDCSEPRSLTRNCLEALDELHSKGLVVTVISGGIHKFVEHNFYSFRACFDFVLINELLLSDSGALAGVRPTSHDFQGNAEALDLLCKQVGCNSDETVFVGDHFNDEAIMLNLALACPCRGRDRWRRKSRFQKTISRLSYRNFS